MTLSRGRQLVGGTLWLLVVQYVVAELLAAAAWTGPSYDVTADVVSDLGRPACTDVGGCSPLSSVFNASLGLHALLVVAGAVVLSPLLPRWRVAVVGLFALTAAGNAMVGAFPLGQGVTDWHLLGATLAIGGGTLAVTAAGLAVRPRHPRFAGFTLLCAAIGVLGLVLLGLEGTTGLAERIAIYPVLLWYVATGALALVAARRRRER